MHWNYVRSAVIACIVVLSCHMEAAHAADADSTLVDRKAGRPMVVAFDVAPGYVSHILLPSAEGDEEEISAFNITLSAPADIVPGPDQWLPTAFVCLRPVDTKGKASYCANLTLHATTNGHGVARGMSETGQKTFETSGSRAALLRVGRYCFGNGRSGDSACHISETIHQRLPSFISCSVLMPRRVTLSFSIFASYVLKTCAMLPNCSVLRASSRSWKPFSSNSGPDDGDVIVDREQADADGVLRLAADRHHSRAGHEQRAHAVPVARLARRAGDHVVERGDQAVERGDVGVLRGRDRREHRVGRRFGVRRGLREGRRGQGGEREAQGERKAHAGVRVEGG